jgi:hypothetical protein
MKMGGGGGKVRREDEVEGGGWKGGWRRGGRGRWVLEEGGGVSLKKRKNHRNISIVHLTQGKTCRDMVLNTRYLVLFNNLIDRQQVATMAKIINPSSNPILIKRFQNAMSRTHSSLVVDL